MACLVVAGCAREDAVQGDAPASHEDFARQLEAVGLSETVMGERWLQSARDALSKPLEVVPPYAESGGFLAHRAGALGLIFDALDGQTLRLQFERRGNSRGRVFVELFYAREPVQEARHVRLGGLPSDASALEVVLPYDGKYIVRLQPELLIDSLYSLQLELDAAVPFPVQVEPGAVGSFFGDPRDAGSRQHEGIDIFAPRNTPVVAVAAGRASAKTTPRGGNVVWLRTPGRSYYYAHLEKAAVSGSRRVEAGEILGYVGNSGNAITTPTHLHFGVYRRGHGAMDPLPRLAARVFEQAPEGVAFSPRYVRTHAGKLNLRAAPDTSSQVLAQLDAGSVVRTTAVRGDWLRVTTPDDRSGWIHGDYQEDLSPVGSLTLATPTVLLDSLGRNARPVAMVEASGELVVIGVHTTHLLVREPGGAIEGWIAGPLRHPDADIVIASDSGDAVAAEQGATAGGAFE